MNIIRNTPVLLKRVTRSWIIHREMAAFSLTKTIETYQSWTDSNTKDTFDVQNPANGKVIAKLPDMTVEDAKRDIEAATKLFSSSEWSNLGAKQRSDLLKNWFRLLQENSEEIANIITCEAGKTLAESKGEIAYGNSFVEWFAEECRRIYGEIIPSPLGNKELMVLKQPIGVAGLITPWNFPHAMIARKAGAALAAGCPVVVKPSEDTPLTAIAMKILADKAGFPKDAIRIISCSRKNAAKIGEEMCKNENIAGISFTGSTEVGRILYKNCAEGIKRVSLELGGNAPFIVFESANLDIAIESALTSKFRNCGQACIASNRFLIQDKIYDCFMAKLKEKVCNLKIGPGSDANVQIGPLINDMQFKKVQNFVNDAKSKGVTILLGGNPLPDLGKLFYEPTILTDVTPDMAVYTEEVFGPIVTAIKFSTEDEALKIANSSQRGLAGYFYSSDINQILRVSRKLQVGMIGINEGMISTAEAPFGGIKQSGIGREGSRHGIDEYVYMKYLCLRNSN